MEGAAVVHAANRVSAPAIEIRAISNTTGNRDAQEWNLELALQNLGKAVKKTINDLWDD
jgi:nucleoside phosphorylase